MKIVVTPPVNEAQKQLLEAAAEGQNFIYCEKPEITEELLRDADIILGNLDDAKQLSWTKQLSWIQLNNAGTEGYCEPGVLPEGAQLTNATGAYGLAISEHMIACLFALRKKLHLYYANQLEQKWRREGFVGVVEGTTVLVLGLGDIGTTFARKMKALGCYIIGVKRHVGEKPEWVDELYSMDEIENLLPRADVIAMSLPGNASTYHVLSRERIELLSQNAVIVNVGRGSAIDTEALADALYEGKIAGAALDVTDPEPLPEDHRLWQAPNALITPHISGGFSLPETLQQIIEIFAENLRHFQAGEKLRNLVDMETGYKKAD